MHLLGRCWVVGVIWFFVWFALFSRCVLIVSYSSLHCRMSGKASQSSTRIKSWRTSSGHGSSSGKQKAASSTTKSSKKKTPPQPSFHFRTNDLAEKKLKVWLFLHDSKAQGRREASLATNDVLWVSVTTHNCNAHAKGQFEMVSILSVLI